MCMHWYAYCPNILPVVPSIKLSLSLSLASSVRTKRKMKYVAMCRTDYSRSYVMPMDVIVCAFDLIVFLCICKIYADFGMSGWMGGGWVSAYNTLLYEQT